MSTNTRIKQPVNPIANVYAKLTEVGIDENYARRMALPDWWDDEIALNPSGFEQAVTYISRYFGIEPECIEDPGGTIALKSQPTPIYKTPVNADRRRLQVVSNIALRAAYIAARACTVEFSAPSSSGSEVRDQILNRGNSSVSLENALDYCWKHGIPVIHVAEMPDGCRPGVDGMAVRFEKRPVIVIANESKYSARLLFILMHELGHVALKHIDPSHFLIDGEVEGASSTDQTEEEANGYALKSLLDWSANTYGATNRVNAGAFANSVKETSAKGNVDPGLISPNYAHAKGSYPLGMNALGVLEPDDNATETISRKISQNICWDELTTEMQDTSRKITGMSLADCLPF